MTYHLHLLLLVKQAERPLEVRELLNRDWIVDAIRDRGESRSRRRANQATLKTDIGQGRNEFVFVQDYASSRQGEDYFTVLGKSDRRFSRYDHMRAVTIGGIRPTTERSHLKILNIILVSDQYIYFSTWDYGGSDFIRKVLRFDFHTSTLDTSYIKDLPSVRPIIQSSGSAVNPVDKTWFGWDTENNKIVKYNENFEIDSSFTAIPFTQVPETYTKWR